MSRRVYIGGFGATTGFGAGVEPLFTGIFAGERAVRMRNRTSGFEAPTAVAAEVPGLEATPEEDRACVLAVAAAEEALRGAGVAATAVDLVFSSTKGVITGFVDGGHGYGNVAMLARRVHAALGARQLIGALSCACASGVLAIAHGARAILRGDCDRALIVGSDVLNEFIIRGFGALEALDPEPCRPFDRNRLGISLGEGGAAILLTAHADESLGVAVTGWGGANDACHVTGPDREGRGVVLAGRRALQVAGLAPTDVDVVHVHGTGTVANDACEALGLAALFGGPTPPAFGTKGQTGHTLGAAGIVETMIAAEALRRGVVPANVGLAEPDVDPAVDLPTEPRVFDGEPRHALKIANGFGGILGAVVVQT